MKIRGKIQLSYENSESAKIVYESLEVDNKGFVESKLTQNNIDYTINNNSLSSFLLTVDDLISSEILVEKLLEKKKYMNK